MRSGLGTCLGVVAWFGVVGETVGGLRFTDVTAASGISHAHSAVGDTLPPQSPKSGGAAAGDFDNDGWVDLYVTCLGSGSSPASNILYRNKGDGTFEDVTAAAIGANHLSGFLSNGCGWADVDNDGDLDLYVLHLEATRYHLFINNGAGVFSEQAAARGANPGGNTTKFGNSVAFGDYDLDGYLDMHVTEWRMKWQADGAKHDRLLRNMGSVAPGHFEDVTVAAGVSTGGVVARASSLDACGYGTRFADIDRDHHPDLLISGDSGTSRLFWNNGDGTFTDGTESSGVGTDTFGMGSALGDYDGDGDLDWFVTSIFEREHALRDGNRLYRNDGSRVFTDQTEAAGVRDGGWGWGTCFGDFDHDRDLDLVQANGQYLWYAADDTAGHENEPTRIWENNGSGVFTDMAGAGSGVADTGQGKGALCFDYDNDGDMDVFIVNNGTEPILYRNDSDGGDWLKVRTVGRESNRQGVGCFVSVVPEAGAGTLVREMSAGSHCFAQSETVAHFGLGTLAGAMVERVTVEWPSGVSQRLEGVAKNQLLVLEEPGMRAEVAEAGGGYWIAWNGATGWRYRVERRDDLETGDWAEVGVVTASDAAPGMDLGVVTGSGFYRVVRLD
jgi:hypothetical protein